MARRQWRRSIAVPEIRRSHSGHWLLAAWPIVAARKNYILQRPVPGHTGSRRSQPVSDNPLKLKSIHHVELWVGNAKQAAYFYRQAFGFSLAAYARLETAQRDHTSYALSQANARLS